MSLSFNKSLRGCAFNSKAVFKITQSGSIEQKWNARILDAKGNAVKSYIFDCII